MLKDEICRAICGTVPCKNLCADTEISVKAILTAVRECKEPISKAIYTGQQNPNIMAHIHNAAIDKVLAKLEGK